MKDWKNDLNTKKQLNERTKSELTSEKKISERLKKWPKHWKKSQWENDEIRSRHELVKSTEWLESL